MFRRLSEPLPLSEASLLALRPALNAPVLNVGFLPVGPARAAIVAFGAEWGGIGLAFGIRSNESGQVAVFRNQESIEPDVPVATALEPILAEAERMGFLFDEDMVASMDDGTGRLQAMALWGRLMGELELPPPPRAVPAEPAARESVRLQEAAPPANPLPPARPTTASSPPPNAPAPTPPSAEVAPVATQPGPPPGSMAEPDELILDERLPELDLGTEGVVVASAPVDSGTELPQDVSQTTQPLMPSGTRRETTPESAAPRPQAASTQTAEVPVPEAPPQQKLSKFRHVDAAAEEENEKMSGGSPLGRIPIVRVRRERDGSKKPSTLARLLGSF